jgi:hypothetical protein
MEAVNESHQQFLNRTLQEVSRAERYCLFLSLVLVDLSEFARAVVNRQGSQRIDLDTLCGQVELGLRNSLRLSDVISPFEKNRLGILLVETSKAGVDNVCRRVETFIRDYLKGGLNLPFEPPLEVRAASYPEEAEKFKALTSQLNRIHQQL